MRSGDGRQLAPKRASKPWARLPLLAVIIIHEVAVEGGGQRLTQRSLRALRAAEENQRDGGCHQTEAGQPSRHETRRIPFDRIAGARPGQQGLAHQQDDRNDIQRPKKGSRQQVAGTRQDQRGDEPGRRRSARPEPQPGGKKR